MNETIKIFNKETIWDKRAKPPVIYLNPKGQIRFSIEAVKLLGLKSGDKLSFAFDTRDSGVIYFYKCSNGIELNTDFKGMGGERLVLCCRGLVKQLLAFFGSATSKTYLVTKDITNFNGSCAWLILKSNRV